EYTGLVSGETAPPGAARRVKDGKPICGRWMPKRGRHCTRHILCKNGRCRTHSGKAASGQASATFKPGRDSKALRKGLRKSVEEFLALPDPLSLLENVAVADARVVELLSRLEHADWPKVKKVWEATKEAAGQGDLAGVMAGMAELDGVFQA